MLISSGDSYDVIGSGFNFFVLQDNKRSCVIVYNQLCEELGRVSINLQTNPNTGKKNEKVELVNMDNVNLYEKEIFKIVNFQTNSIKYYDKNGKQIFK